MARASAGLAAQGREQAEGASREVAVVLAESTVADDPAPADIVLTHTFDVADMARHAAAGSGAEAKGDEGDKE